MSWARRGKFFFGPCSFFLLIYMEMYCLGLGVRRKWNFSNLWVFLSNKGYQMYIFCLCPRLGHVSVKPRNAIALTYFPFLVGSVVSPCFPSRAVSGSKFRGDAEVATPPYMNAVRFTFFGRRTKISDSNEPSQFGPNLCEFRRT